MNVKGPERRAYHSSFVHNKKLFIYGGSGIEDGTLASLWVLDTAKVAELQALSPEDEARRGHSYIEWRRVETAGSLKPGPLAHHSSVVHGDKMYLFGGSGPRVPGQALPDGTVPATWTLDLLGMKWEPVVPRGDQPLTRDDHTAVNYKDQAMIIFGGFVDGGERTNEIWKYSFSENRWTLIKPQQGPSPRPRAGHSALISGETLIMFGGCDQDNEKLNDLWVFHLETNTWREL